jgi:hypothetical protein
LKKIKYFYKNNIHILPPSSDISDYLILFNFLTTGEEDYNSCISFFKEKLKGIENKKVILIVEDEGHYGSYIPNVFKDNFFDLIDEFSKSTKNEIHLIVQNIIAGDIVEKKGYSFKAHGTSYFSENYLSLDKSYDEIYDDRFNKNKIEKTFISYNRAARIQRIYLHYKLDELNIKDKGLFYWHGNHFDISTLELLTKYYGNYFNLEFLKNLNYSNQILPEKKLPVHDVRLGQEVIWEDYNKTFLSLVTETQCGNDTVYFSEKIFKPIVSLHPFLLVGSPNSLKELKKIGYKTFDKWWDESYDLCDNLFDRINKICDILLKLNNLSKEEMFKIRLEMKDILIHNYENYKKRSNNNFLLDKIIEINNS